MDEPAAKPKRNGWDDLGMFGLVAGVLFAGALTAMLLQGAWSLHALQPLRGGGSLIPFLLLLFWMLFVPLGLAVWIGLCLRRTRMLLIAALLVSAAFAGYFPLVTVATRLQDRVWQACYPRIRERGQPIIDALRSFERDHGHPPGGLVALVPEYLPDIPTTGVDAYPDFLYREATAWRKTSWQLTASTPRGIIDFSAYVYCSDPKDPDLTAPSSEQRVGQWVYIRD